MLHDDAPNGRLGFEEGWERDSPNEGTGLTRGGRPAIEAALFRFVSSLFLASWLWALALAASPSLHDWAHGHDEDHDEDHEEHVCMATLLASGICDAPAIAPLLAGTAEFVEIGVMPARGDEVVALFLIGSPLEHGPPVVGA
jgi:hypothetical protein